MNKKQTNLNRQLDIIQQELNEFFLLIPVPSEWGVKVEIGTSTDKGNIVDVLKVIAGVIDPKHYVIKKGFKSLLQNNGSSDVEIWGPVKTGSIGKTFQATEKGSGTASQSGYDSILYHMTGLTTITQSMKLVIRSSFLKQVKLVSPLKATIYRVR